MKRVKSSLGKRSSSISAQLSHTSDINASSRLSTNKKKSLLLQPGFTRQSRSNSMDTLNDGPHEASRYGSAKKPMQRSKSQANLMTPCTPRNTSTVSGFMGSAKSVRSKMSLDNRERMSSMGGRIPKKDTRPIGDKDYIQEMTQMVHRLAMLNPDCRNLMNNGKIRPMSTQLFIMLSEMVLQYFDPKLVLNNGNYATEIPNIAKLFMYRGKLDKTMLITVSTPHTYPNVIAFLAWFVECQKMAQALNFELLFSQGDGPGDFEEEQDDMDFSIFIPHVAKIYNMEHKGKSCDQLNEEFMYEMRKKSLVSSEEYDRNEQESEELRETYEQIVSENDTKQAEVQELFNANTELVKSTQQQDKYIMELELFLSNINKQQVLLEQTIEGQEEEIIVTSNEIANIQQAVQNQELSLEDKDKLATERAQILREINILEAQIASCNDICYNEQMSLSKNKNQMDACIVKHNNDLYKLKCLPGAQKDLAIDINILDAVASEHHIQVGNHLDSLLTKLEAQPDDLEEKLASVQTDIAKQDTRVKAIQDQLTSFDEKINILSLREKETLCKQELEIQQLESDVKRLEGEIEIVTLQMPNVLDAEKQLLQKKQDLENLHQLKRKYEEWMKQRFLALDKAFEEKVHAVEENETRIAAKRNQLQRKFNK